jgi:hypothetical protein
VDLRHPEILGGPQAGDARMTIINAQVAGFGKFYRGAFDFAVEGIGGGEARPNVR